MKISPLKGSPAILIKQEEEPANKWRKFQTEHEMSCALIILKIMIVEIANYDILTQQSSIFLIYVEATVRNTSWSGFSYRQKYLAM